MRQQVLDLARRLDARTPRHPHVHQNDVGHELRGPSRRPPRRRTPRRRARCRLLAEDHLEPPPEQRVIVDDHHAESLGVSLAPSSATCSSRRSTHASIASGVGSLAGILAHPLAVRWSSLAVVIADLSFEPFLDAVDRGRHVLGLRHAHGTSFEGSQSRLDPRASHRAADAAPRSPRHRSGSPGARSGPMRQLLLGGLADPHR